MGTVPLPVIAAFAAEAGLAILYVLVAGGFPDLHESLTELVDLNGEGNLPAWFSSMQFLVIALLLMVFVIDRIERSEKPWAVAMAALVFIFLSVDEAAQIHERFGQVTDVLLPGGSRLNTSLWRTGIGNALLVPVALVGFWLLWRGFRKYMPFQGQGKLVTGVLVFIFAASVPEMLSNFISSRNVMILERLIEEIGEMIGITLVLWGTLQFLVAHEVKLSFAEIGAARRKAEPDSGRR